MNPTQSGAPSGSLGTYMWKGRKSLRMFGPNWIESLSHVHPIVPLLVWGPLSLASLFYAVDRTSLTGYQIGSWVFFGLLSWTLAEYLLHRYVFHLEIDSHWGRRLHFILHGVHHDDPNDPTRLVMPPAAAAVLALVLVPLFYTVLGPQLTWPFFTGFVWGYLAYDYIHFATHHFTPRTAVGRFLKQSHMVHHFVDPNSRWGVSSPLWDYVFGTAGKKKERKAAH